MSAHGIRSALVIPCPYCSVPAGALCVTSGGNHAEAAHSARAMRVWGMKRSDYGRAAREHLEAA